MEIHFNKNRNNHCTAVAQVMYYTAKEIKKLPEDEARKMFFLGYIHDCMYDFETDEHLHNEVLAEVVSEKYAYDILNHSKITTNYQSVALDLLYFADQIVDGYGRICSFEDRIKDIYERHGLEDGVYQDTVEIVDYLRNHGFNVMETQVLNHFNIEQNGVHFTENRNNHCTAVAQVMYYVAKEIYQLPENKCREMFFLGYIHDCMYDFETNEQLHNEVLADIVTKRYAYDVLNHSKITTNYQSVALDLLYFADQIVDGYGRICSFEDRIKDIYERHGLEDGVYQDTIEIVDYLYEHGFGEIESQVLEHFGIDHDAQDIVK